MGKKMISKHCLGCKGISQPAAILKQWDIISPATKGWK
jgi:hypothetical protein